MKSLFRIALILSTTGYFISCGPGRNVSFTVTRPAEITMPSEAQTILVVDRTQLDNKALNIIEGILTGEMPGDDKIAAQEAMNSLKMRLDNSPRFNVKILPDRMKGNSLDGSFPQSLDWNTIDRLCKQNGADLVVALEVFDSDFVVTNGTRVKKRVEGKGENRREVEYTEYYAQGVGRIKMGIRTYYNGNKTIVDQQLIHKNNTWEGVGTSAADAVLALISKGNANKQLAKLVGDDYAYKISPMPVRISRPFYAKSKKTPAVAGGTRLADVDKWNDAINTWKQAIPSAREKDRGKLAYNIAIGYEVLGEYGTALTWAQDSYARYGNKKGRDYVRSLQHRINEENLLKQQMR